MPKRKSDKEKASKESKPPKITYKPSAKFLKEYFASSDEVQRDIDNSLQIINDSGIFTPGMRPRKLTGTKYWYMRAGKGTRITFTYGSNNEILLHMCGNHDMLRKIKRNK